MFSDQRVSFDRSLSLLIIYILWKIEENLCFGRFFFQVFCPRIIEFSYYFSYPVLAKAHFKGWVLTERMTRVQIIYLTDPLKSNLTEKKGHQRIIFIIFQLTTTEAMSSYEGWFVKVGVVFHALYLENKVGDPPMVLHFWHR